MGDSKIEEDSTEVNCQPPPGGCGWVAKIDHGLEVPIIRDFKIRRQNGNENVKKQKKNRFNKQNNNFACASHLFVYFFAVFCTTTTTKCLI